MGVQDSDAHIRPPSVHAHTRTPARTSTNYRTAGVTQHSLRGACVFSPPSGKQTHKHRSPLHQPPPRLPSVRSPQSVCARARPRAHPSQVRRDESPRPAVLAATLLPAAFTRPTRRKGFRSAPLGPVAGEETLLTLNVTTEVEPRPSVRDCWASWKRLSEDSLLLLSQSKPASSAL